MKRFVVQLIKHKVIWRMYGIQDLKVCMWLTYIRIWGMPQGLHPYIGNWALSHGLHQLSTSWHSVSNKVAIKKTLSGVVLSTKAGSELSLIFTTTYNARYVINLIWNHSILFSLFLVISFACLLLNIRTRTAYNILPHFYKDKAKRR